MDIDVVIEESCLECNIPAQYDLQGKIDEFVRHKVVCDTCNHKFVVVVNLELDSWTE